MGTVWKILLWWVLFGGTHILGSALPVRRFLIHRFGLWAFKGIYSVVALITLLQLSFVYFLDRHAGPELFAPLPGSRLATQAVMFISLLILGQAFAASNPMATVAEMTGRLEPRARGIHRVTRHPMNFGFFLFGAAHCLSNRHLGDWIFFGGFVVYAVASAVHQDRRILAAGPEPAKRFLAETSLVPFSAILAGRQRLAPGEYSLLAAGVSVAAFIVLRLGHASLFGGFGS